MDAKKFQRKAYVLGKDHSLRILYHIHSQGWTKASDVAEELDIHTATASKYLEELEEVGILEMRKAKGETREVKEYRIENPMITLEYDLSEDGFKEVKDDEVGFYQDLFRSIFERTKEVYGPSVEDDFSGFQGDNGTHLKGKEKRDLVELIDDLLEFNEKNIGVYSTNRLVRRAGMKVIPGYKDSLECEELLDYFPKKYTKMLRRQLR